MILEYARYGWGGFFRRGKQALGVDSSRLKIIILTSSENKKDAEAVNHYNELIYCFLTKPLEEKNVKEVIQSIQ